MPAPTKIWTVPVPARQDPAAPITTSWGNDTWDNLQFLMEWLGADYIAAAAQNHNHDGINSAKVNIFEGLMPNGTFDEVSAGQPVGWDITQYIGGTVASSSAVNKHGDKVLAFTSTVLANGGGEAVQIDYKPVTDGVAYGIEIYRWASVANVSCKAVLLWYDSAKAHISTTTLFADADTPTVPTLYSSAPVSPANARFVRVLVSGGVPATGTAVGTVYFDGGRLQNPLAEGSVLGNNLYDSVAGSYGVTPSLPSATIYSTTYVKTHEFKVGRDGSVATNLSLRLVDSSSTGPCYAQVRINGVAVGTERSNTTPSLVNYAENIDVKSGDLVQLYARENTGLTGCIVDFGIGIANPLDIGIG